MESELKFKYNIEDLDDKNIKNKLIPYMNELANRLLNNNCRDVTITTNIKIINARAKVQIIFKEN